MTQQLQHLCPSWAKARKSPDEGFYQLALGQGKHDEFPFALQGYLLKQVKETVVAEQAKPELVQAFEKTGIAVKVPCLSLEQCDKAFYCSIVLLLTLFRRTSIGLLLDHEAGIFLLGLTGAQPFLKPARVEVSLQTADAVDEERTVEVIDLVL